MSEDEVQIRDTTNKSIEDLKQKMQREIEAIKLDLLEVCNNHVVCHVMCHVMYARSFQCVM